jgi:hypothetical protein
MKMTTATRMKKARRPTMTDPFELRRIVDRMCREDFRSFAIRAFPVLESGLVDLAHHIDVISHFLQKVHRGEVRRGLVCIPPRYLKTYLITIAYSAWLLGKNPKARIICAAYGMELAEKFNADTLKLIKSPWYRRIFPHTHINPKKQSKTEFETTAGGYRLATSVGGTMTGRGADLIIVDDPLKAGEGHSPTARRSSIEWFNSTVHTRFNQPKKGKIIVVAQRLHAEDLPGHLIEVGGWHQLIECAARDAAVVVALAQFHPAFAGLAEHIGGAGLALGMKRVEVLLETLLARLPRIDRTAHPACHLARLSPLPGLHAAALFCLRPKNAGPDQRVPVMARATSLRLRQVLSFQHTVPSSLMVTTWTLPFHSRTSRMPGWAARVTEVLPASWARVWLVRRDRPPWTLAWSSQPSASRSSLALTRGSGRRVRSVQRSRNWAVDIASRAASSASRSSRAITCSPPGSRRHCPDGS